MKSNDFADDWYGWLTNQCGHICLGLALDLVMTELGMPIWWRLGLIILLYWLLIEVFAQRLRLWRDAIMDTAFVAAGVTFMQAPLPVAMVCAALLAFGVAQRLMR